MTEEAKRQCLLVVKEILRQARPQLDTSGWQQVYDSQMQTINNTPLLREDLLPLAIEILDVISSYRERLEGFESIVRYVEDTPAEDLDVQEVGARLKKYGAPPNTH